MSVTSFTQVLPMRTAIRPLALAILVAAAAQPAFAQQDDSKKAVLPTVVVESMSEQDPTKSYVNYKQASVTRNGQDVKDTPQTIDTIDVQKYKLYGMNDLSVMLAGTPGITTSYDMRGDGITIRGFGASDGDIYRDGIRESGQIRRSTANIERIEVLKGPASLLYGRSAGGGVINMVSKYANFESNSSVGVYAGSWDNYGATVDVNHVINENVAVRVTSEAGESDSFRAQVANEIRMISPSVTFNNREGLEWTLQYTYDKLTRSPDRGPSYENLPAGTSKRASFVQDGDFVDDILNVFRSDLTYAFNDKWSLNWALSHREAEQNFDHFYGGTYCDDAGKTLTGGNCTWNGYIRQNSYAWQETMNKTDANALELKGEFLTGGLQHNLLVGLDSSWEDREPSLYTNGNHGVTFYGYVNPFNYADRYNDRDTKPRPAPTQTNHHKAESHALFIQDVITLVPEVKLVLGARYDWFEFGSTNLLLEPGAANRSRSYNDSTFSPSVGVVWQPVEAHSFYASYNKSFSPYGGRGMLSVSTSSTAVYDADPQYNEQYEIGVKSDWLNQRLNTQISVFNIEKNNIRYRPDPDNDPYTWAVQGQHRSKGVEFSFIGRVIDTIYVRGGYGWQEAQVRVDVVTPTNVGRYLSGSSKDSGNLFVRYVPSERWYAEVGVTRMGALYTSQSFTPGLESYERFDAAVGYSINNVNITLAVSNLSDKEYWRASSMPGSPRNVLLRANYQF